MERESCGQYRRQSNCRKRVRTEVKLSPCVTNINPNLSNNQPLPLLSSDCNAQVQKTICPITAMYASPQTVRNLSPCVQQTTYPINGREKRVYTETVWSVTTHHSRLVTTLNHLYYVSHHIQPITQLYVPRIHCTSAYTCCRQLASFETGT